MSYCPEPDSSGGNKMKIRFSLINCGTKSEV